MLKDLLISHPTPENMHIIPTSRDPITNLALSSRNAYLSPSELGVAGTLYEALSAARFLYDFGDGAEVTGEHLVGVATRVVQNAKAQLDSTTEKNNDKVRLDLDYIEVFDKETFEPVRGPVGNGRELVIAGAIWVGQTRLIDNLLLGWDM